MISLCEGLWATSPLERLRTARSIGPNELHQVTTSLLEGCPFSAWPYGCNTAINPWIVFVGPSPGTSPAADDANYVTRFGVPPSAGTPPVGMEYSDSRGFFERLRSLTIALISAELGFDVSLSDALSLSGLMNLDSGAKSEARNVEVDAAFASWSLDVSIRRLRPRYVIGVGLGSFLGEPRHGWLRDLLTSYVGSPFMAKRAPNTAPFEGYREKQYAFRAWPLRNGGTHPQHLIILPQHPSRAPMTSPSIWENAVRECVAFARAL